MAARLDYTMKTQELRTNMLCIGNNKMLLKLHWQYNGIGIVEEWSLLQLIKILAASLYNEFYLYQKAASQKLLILMDENDKVKNDIHQLEIICRFDIVLVDILSMSITARFIFLNRH